MPRWEGTERALTHQRINLTMIPEGGVLSYLYITCIIRVFHVFYWTGLETFAVIIFIGSLLNTCLVH